MVETTEHGVRAHGNILAKAMSGSGIEDVMRCRRRIRDTYAPQLFESTTIHSISNIDTTRGMIQRC